MNELPQEPVKPLDSDCCGQGCMPCVFDIYDEEMKIWQRDCERILNGEEKPDTMVLQVCKHKAAANPLLFRLLLEMKLFLFTFYKAMQDFNPLPNDTVLDLTKLKTFADDEN